MALVRAYDDIVGIGSPSGRPFDCLCFSAGRHLLPPVALIPAFHAAEQAGLLRKTSFIGLVDNALIERLPTHRAEVRQESIFVAGDWSSAKGETLARFLESELLPIYTLAHTQPRQIQGLYRDSVSRLPVPEGVNLEGTLEQAIVLLYYLYDGSLEKFQITLNGVHLGGRGKVSPGDTSVLWAWTAAVLAFGEIITRVRVSTMGPQPLVAPRLARFTAALADYLYTAQAKLKSASPYAELLCAYVCRAMLDVAEAETHLLPKTQFSIHRPERWHSRLDSTVRQVELHSVRDPLFRSPAFRAAVEFCIHEEALDRRYLRSQLRSYGADFAEIALKEAILSRDVSFDRIQILFSEHERFRAEQPSGYDKTGIQDLEALMEANDSALERMASNAESLLSEYRELSECIASVTKGE